MKTTELTGQSAAQDIRDLMIRCGVSELPACRRAGIAPSTPHRWRSGSTPKQGKVERMMRAVLELADEAGTLPDDMKDPLNILRANVELPERDLESRVGRLERVVVEQLGASL